eukprot:2970187-Rhodomonas_salina.2
MHCEIRYEKLLHTYKVWSQVVDFGTYVASGLDRHWHTRCSLSSANATCASEPALLLIGLSPSTTWHAPAKTRTTKGIAALGVHLSV